MPRGRPFVLLACALGASCGETLAAPVEPDASVDAGMDVDAEAGVDAMVDADSGSSCESLAADIELTDVGTANVLVADAAHLYAATTNGVRRKNIDGSDVPLVLSVEPATDVLLTVNYVVWRRQNGELHSKPKNDPGVSSTVLYGGSQNGLAIEPRSQDGFLILRDNDVYGCPAAGGNCAGTLLDRPVLDVVANGANAFDFLAGDNGAIGVFHCASNCDAFDAGVRVAVAGNDVPDLVSDATFLYWIEKPKGLVRRAPRTGGPAEDVMTGLVAPLFLALDGQSRILVGTQVNGVFRGSTTGTCRAPAGGGPAVSALTVGPTAVFIASASKVFRLQP